MVKVDQIRVSIGSAVKLGLKRMKVDVLPTNCHLLTYHPEGCWGNCGFCPQSQFTHQLVTDSKEDQEYLSRVLWPAFELNKVVKIFAEKFHAFDTEKTGFQRICIQSLYYEKFEIDLINILKNLQKVTSIPISIAIPPIAQENILKYKELGVERICFALDTATSELFSSVKGSECDGPYSWEDHLKLLKKSVEIFGNGLVSTHLIIGLGENEQETVKFIQEMKDLGILIGLFAFFPIKKTRFESKPRPNIVSFRKAQLAKYLIDTKKFSYDDLIFNDLGTIVKFPIDSNMLREIIGISAPFQTSGCPGCNRPYYTSTPREEQYNYPRSLKESEKQIIYNELSPFCEVVRE